MVFYAHSLEGESLEKWQKLEEHLNNVAKIAGEFAEQFDAEGWGKAEGYNHDVGKGTLHWQAFLRRANGVVDEFAQYYVGHPNHAASGAQWLYRNSKDVGKLLAYCIAGHHGGLPSWDGSRNVALKDKLQEPLAEITAPLSSPDLLCDLPITLEPERAGFQFQFFVRMLFSCLVDADFLDTEAWLDKEKSKMRPKWPEIQEVHRRFWENFNQMRKKADKNLNVNRQREVVLSDCLEAAELEPGLFSLTVPTGGGKTLASMAFALNHALRRGKRRIIYVIPFTSIIEQNANVFREVLGNDTVLEHHCNFIFKDSDWRSRLAAENWDAPIIVTTNVQFFDSFYARKTSQCRKLHRIANSIVIFDEVQVIPVEKLKPCIEVIKELTKNYGVTPVLCTATQPAVHRSAQFQSGLENVTEIIQDVPNLFCSLKRTEEHFIGSLSVQDVAGQLTEYRQILCIVNTRQQALDIHSSLPESDENKHLSALMYPQHRAQILKDIKERLASNDCLPCRVVSTQLIEAGVDVDFPCVYRAVAGIDSIAQAAGRCNRNGLSSTPCAVKVFEFQDNEELSFNRQAAQSAKKLFKFFAGKLTDPLCVHEYFSDYFWKNEQRMDADGILENYCRVAQGGNIQFIDIAKFHMINSVTVPVIIALEDHAIELINSLEHAVHKGGILRKLQQYCVQIYPYQFEEIKGWVEMIIPDVWVLRSEELYSMTSGLKCKPPQGNAFFG